MQRAFAKILSAAIPRPRIPHMLSWKLALQKHLQTCGKSKPGCNTMQTCSINNGARRPYEAQHYTKNAFANTIRENSAFHLVSTSGSSFRPRASLGPFWGSSLWVKGHLLYLFLNRLRVSVRSVALFWPRLKPYHMVMALGPQDGQTPKLKMQMKMLRAKESASWVHVASGHTASPSQHLCTMRFPP